MRVLAIDIETSPNLADVWGLWQQNVSISQLRQATRMICFAAKWTDNKGAPAFCSEWDDGRAAMIGEAWNLLDTADAVVHYNGNRFDTPHLRREFLSQNMLPPSPFHQIDIYKEVKRLFAFPSYKLAYVAPALGVGRKVKHEGHELWVKVLAGDPAARKRMATYCKRDVALLPPLLNKLRPWIDLPSMGAMTGERVCPKCGSDQLTRNGYAYTKTRRYQRYRCSNCGCYPRDTRSIDGTGITAVPL